MLNRRMAHYLSKRLHNYFLGVTVLNVVLLIIVLTTIANDVNPNGIFFEVASIFTIILDNVTSILTQLLTIVAVVAILSLRPHFVRMMGLEHRYVVWDYRDLLTCFSMHRFSAVELLFWKVEQVPKSQNLLSASRSVFLHAVSGYNEPQTTRVKEIGWDEGTLLVKERFTFNFDPMDTDFKLLLTVKKQEVIGADAAAALAPSVGAVAGGVASSINMLGAVPGAVGGAALGVSAASSVGEELSRIELSTSMINELLEKSRMMGMGDGGAALPLSMINFGDEAGFQQLPMVPMGNLFVKRF